MSSENILLNVVERISGWKEAIS